MTESCFWRIFGGPSVVKPTVLFMLKGVSLLAFICSISPEQPKQKPKI